jgi:tetratricopeptide (TPR) repeat protein
VKQVVLSISVFCWVSAALGLAQTASRDSYTEAISAFQQGKLEQAEQALRTAIAAEADRPDLLGLLGVVLDAKKEFDQAELFHQRAVKLAPRSSSLWNNLGNHYLSRQDDKQAEAAFLRVIQIDPGHANANLQLARIAVAQKRGADALRYLDQLKDPDQGATAVQILRARALYAAGRTDAALAIIDRIEKDAADDVRLSFSLGTTLAEWEKYDRAEAAFSRALEKDPANVEILHNVGLAALRAGHLDRAQRVFEIAARERPGDVDSTFNLARVHAARGDNETALVLLAQARRLAPGRPDLLLSLARMYAEAGFFSGAADAYEAYLNLQPEDSSARRERGFAYCRFGRMQTGLPDLNWYVKQYPRDPIGHFELGLCETSGDAGHAFQHLTEALRLKPDFTPARQAHGWLLLREGKWQEALPDLKSVVEREPKNAMALLQLGRIYLELERPAEALEFLRRARELAPEHTGVLKQLHRTLRAVGQDREAAIVLEKLKTAGPDRTPLKAEAQIFGYMGLDPAQQRERFRRNLMNAIDASPTDAELKVQLGAMLLGEGKTEEGRAAFRETLTQSPDARILNEGAAALLEHKQYALAREFLIRLVAADPSIENRLDLAVAIFHSAGPDASLAEIEKVPLADRNGDVYLLKAQIQDALGRFEDAVVSLNTAFQRAPTRGDLYFWASLFLIKHNRDQQALQLLNQATKIVPDDPDLLLTRATVLELDRKTGDAEDLLKKIQLRWPEWGRIYLIRGIIQATHRNPEEALQSIQTAIALGERTSSAYYYLADVSRSVRPGNRDAARRAIAEALRLDPEDASSHALAGKIALDADEPAKAVKHLNDAIRLKPNLIEAHYSLSIAYKKLGRQEQASAELDLLRRLREQSPQSEENSVGIRQMLFASEGPR